MKELTINEIEQVNGAGVLGELINVVSGAALGCATAATLFSGVNVAWLGVVPLSLPLAGAFIGGSIGATLYNIESISYDLATATHAAVYN
jgi:hypothetical protein